jgi:dolichyl-phosphate-mannose--protein O-mannosyl transferase
MGAIIAFISYALPWWTTTVSLGTSYSLYLNEAAATFPASMSLWYAWTALAVIIIAAVLGVLGSLVESTRLILLVGALLTLLSVVIFAVGLQNELSNLGSSFWGSILLGGPAVGLFSSGSYLGVDYTTYLSFGFWLALIGAILMLVACRKRPAARIPTAQPPQSVSQPPT